MDLKLNKLSKILGLEILNLDLKKVIDKKLKIKLNDLFVENKVLVIRKQFLNPNEFQKAAEIFGKIFRQHNSKFSLKENPLVHYISNQDKFSDGKIYIPGEGFHTDHSNDKKPPKATILLSKEIPSYGGDTQFINMNLLYENLSKEMKTKIKNDSSLLRENFAPAKLLSAAANGVATHFKKNGGDLDVIFGESGLNHQDLEDPIKEINLQQFVLVEFLVML